MFLFQAFSLICQYVQEVALWNPFRQKDTVSRFTKQTKPISVVKQSLEVSSDFVLKAEIKEDDGFAELQMFQM